MLDKLQSMKLWGFVGLIALSTWVTLAGHATGESLFTFWTWLFGAYVAGNVVQKASLAKYTTPTP